MIRLMTLLAAFLATVAVCRADDRTPLAGKKALDSYSLGYEFGSTLRGQEVAVDEQVLFAAIREALAGKEPALKIEEIRDNLKALRKQVLIRYNLRRNEAVAMNKRDGEAFLAANRSREGVVTLASGLQYKILAEGHGPRPQASDRVSVRYRGTLVDGTAVNDAASGNEPLTVRVDETIPAWREALQLMTAGSKWQLFVPAELAYGSRPYGTIPPSSALVYELELVAVEHPAPAAPQSAQ